MDDNSKKIKKELQSIKKLLILLLIKNGATSEDIDRATGMGAGNIRALFPKKKRENVNINAS